MIPALREVKSIAARLFVKNFAWLPKRANEFTCAWLVTCNLAILRSLRLSLAIPKPRFTLNRGELLTFINLRNNQSALTIKKEIKK